MSMFKPVTLTCPACGFAQGFDAALSVNADRRPDLRQAIVADDFQRVDCSNCGQALRMDADFTLLDQAHGLWIAAQPLAALGHWSAQEGAARAMFDEAYGAGASRGAQAIGAKLHARVSFGWAGLREKLYIADQGLDDVSIELLKMAALRSGAPAPIAADTELRLVDVQGDTLVLAWLLSTDQSVDSTLSVARSLYEDIAADADGAWAPLRESVGAGLYVDINRWLLPQPA